MASYQEEKRGYRCILDQDNYQEWSARTRLILKKKDLWEAVEGWPVEYRTLENGEQQVVEPSAKERARRNRKNNTALSEIAELVNKEALHEIELLSTAKEAWDKLKETNVNLDYLYEISFLRDLMNVQLKDDQVGEYINKIIDLGRKVDQHLEVSMTDRGLGTIALANLPRKFDLMVRTVDKSKISLAYVKAQIRQEIIREKQDKERTVAEEVRSLVLKKEDNSKGESSGSAFVMKNKPFNPNFKKKTQSNQENSKYGSNSGNNQETRKFICYTCGEPDHMARECPNYAKKKEEYMKREDKQKREEKKKEDKKGENSNKVGSLKIEKIQVLCLSNQDGPKQKTGYLMLDGGATDHMLNSKDLFIELKEVKGEVSQGDGSSLAIEGIGKAELKLSDECGGWKLLLSEVYYIPTLADNIISQGTLEEKGVKFVTENGLTTASLNGEDIFLAHRVGKLYYVTLNEYSGGIEEMRRSLARISLSTWHSRMGHLHEEALKKTPIKSKKTEENTLMDRGTLGGSSLICP